MVDYNKKTDLKSIKQDSEICKNVFSEICVAPKGLVVGKPLIDFGKHFVTLNPEVGICKFRPSDKFLVGDIGAFYKTHKTSGVSGKLKEMTKVNNQLYLGDGEEEYEFLGITDELTKQYQNDIEIFQSIVSNMGEPTEVPREIVRQLHLNEYYTIIDTPIQPIRISNSILPTLKFNKTVESKLYVYTIDHNEQLFKGVFRIVTNSLSSWHVYLIVKEG